MFVNLVRQLFSKIFATLLSTLLLFVIFVVPAGAQVAGLPPKPPAPAPEPLFPAKIHPEVVQAAAAEEKLNLIVFLTARPIKTIADQEKQSFVPQLSQLSGQIRQLTAPFNLNHVVPAAIRQQVKALHEQQDSLLDQMRGNIYTRLETEVKPQQDAFEQFVQTTFNGVVTNKVLTDNSLGVEISSEFLQRLSQHPNVLHVALNHNIAPLLDDSAPTIGANTWWNHGLDGDGVTDVAVVDTGVANHPALSSHRYAASEMDFRPNVDNPSDNDGHGTAIAGIIVSTNATYKGIGFGLDKIVNAKIGTGDAPVAEQRMKDAVEWAVTDTTAGKKTAEIVNISYS